MSLHVYLLCHNEEVLLPHTIEHYRRRVPGVTFTILDNESSDNSVAIAKKLGCAVETFHSNGKLDDVILRDLKNAAVSRTASGWVIVADMDEWLCVTEQDLAREERAGTTVLKVEGWNVFGESATATLHDIDLHALNTGQRHNKESKAICFRRPQISAMNYGFGAHTWAPEGTVAWSTNTYRLKHMAWLGLPFIVQKYQQRYERGKEQTAQNLGTHYTDDVNKVTAEFALRRTVARRFSERPYNATPSLLRRVVRRLRRLIA
jgi:hypothetical protein